MEALPEFEDILQKTTEFHGFAVTTGFLSSTNVSLLNYANNVDALFANKLCQVVESPEIYRF